MRHPITCWLSVLAAGTVTTAIFFTNPFPESDPLVGVPLDPEIAASNADLDARRLAIHRRAAAKDELITALIAGRLTLAQVAAEFLRLNAEDEGVVFAVRQLYPGATDEEKSARNVLRFVSLHPIPTSDRDRALVRLEREFAETFGLAASAETELHRPPLADQAPRRP